jgi:hypothetical protein
MGFPGDTSEDGTLVDENNAEELAQIETLRANGALAEGDADPAANGITHKLTVKDDGTRHLKRLPFYGLGGSAATTGQPDAGAE